MAQFIVQPTRYLPFGAIDLKTFPRQGDCTTDNYCQPTEQTDNIKFQFLAAEGSDVITDGDFGASTYDPTCGVQSWCGGGWYLPGNNTIQHQDIADVRVSGLGLVQQSVFTLNNFYTLTFTISGSTSGAVSVQGVQGANIIGNGNLTFSFEWTDATTTDLKFIVTDDFNGAISNVVCLGTADKTDYTYNIVNLDTLVSTSIPAANITQSKNVITVDYNWADDLTLLAGCYQIQITYNGSIFEDDFTGNVNQGWTFDEIGASVLSIIANLMRWQGTLGDVGWAIFNNLFIIGNSYQITYDVLNLLDGQVQVYCGDTGGTIRSGNGTFVETLICTNSTRLRFRFEGTVIGPNALDIDNISITGTSLSGESSPLFLEDEHTCSQLYIWRNSGNLYNFDYSGTFQHEMRILSNMRQSKYPTELNLGEDSANDKFVDYAGLRRARVLEIDRAAEHVHNALAAFFTHDTRTIDNTSYVIIDEYITLPPNDDKLLTKNLMEAKVEIQQSIQTNQVNRNE